MSRDTGSGPGDSVKEAIPETGRKKDGYIVTRAGFSSWEPQVAGNAIGPTSNRRQTHRRCETSVRALCMA